MDDDQQFCLRWNNHQSTLVAVFDTLLENEKLVDVTLAAEGKFLNAHKVVLSACSPYFESLLSRHYDKHPILILKDVKFQELKAMMDYMYRGEVNISQDQLGALLKAAESLQIKGLSDNKKDDQPVKRPLQQQQQQTAPKSPQQLPKVQGLTIEQRNRDDREGSMSPGPRKKKRMRRKSEDMDNHHDASNSSDAHSLPPQNIPQATTQLPVNVKMNNDVPDTIESKQDILTRHKEETGSQVPMMKEKHETHSELMIEPKSEYVDEMNEDSIEDLTLDDDDLSNMEQMDDGAGPSHGGEGSSQQGFAHWQVGNQSQDEVFLAAQEAVGAHRDSQARTTRPAKHRLVNPVSVGAINKTPIINLDEENESSLYDIMDIQVLSEPDANDADAEDRRSVVTLDDLSNGDTTWQGWQPRPFACERCNMSFKHASSLNYHVKFNVCLKQEKDDVILMCDLCNAIFKHPNSLRYHRKHSVCTRPVKEQKDPICPTCNKQFTTITALNYHVKHNVCEVARENQILACSKCQMTFHTRQALRYHESHNVCTRPKREVMEYICDLCSKPFSSPTAFDYHIKNRVCSKPVKEPVVRDPLDLTCPKCNKVFTSPSSHKYHVDRDVCSREPVVKREPAVQVCPHCGKVFTNSYSYKYHIERKVCFKLPRGPRAVVEEEKQCHLCQTIFKHGLSLRYHLEHNVCLKPKPVKSEPRSLQCEKCKKVFGSTLGLDYHEERRVCEQPDGPPYVCHTCDTTFERKYAWKEHITDNLCKQFALTRQVPPETASETATAPECPETIVKVEHFD